MGRSSACSIVFKQFPHAFNIAMTRSHNPDRFAGCSGSVSPYFFQYNDSNHSASSSGTVGILASHQISNRSTLFFSSLIWGMRSDASFVVILAAMTARDTKFIVNGQII